MSAPYENHSDKNYPEDKVTHYPHKKRAKSGGPLHNVANRLNAKARALKNLMKQTGGKYAGKGYAE